MENKDKAEAEELILNSQAETIVSAIGEGISIQDTYFKIVYQNEIHKKLLGEHIGEYCYKAYRGREINCEGCPLILSFENGLAHKVERKVEVDGKTIYLGITASPLRDRNGEIIAGIEVVRDITDCKQTEELLRHETVIVSEGGEAIDIYKKAIEDGQPFDAVIIDLLISFGMGGKETIAKLIEIDPNVNAIVSSGYSDDPIISSFEKYGFKDVLAKPYEITELRRVLHKVIQK